MSKQFRDKVHMTKSLNADQWKVINDHCNKGGVRLWLRWVKGHLETKKTDLHFSDHDFALNYHADKFCEATSGDYQVSAHDAANFIFNAGRIKRIQTRLAAIICSPLHEDLEQHERQDKKVRVNPLVNAIADSKHVVFEQLNSLNT